MQTADARLCKAKPPANVGLMQVGQKDSDFRAHNSAVSGSPGVCELNNFLDQTMAVEEE